MGRAITHSAVGLMLVWQTRPFSCEGEEASKGHLILKYNSPFHVDQWNVEGLLIKRDVTAGVHSSAILGYFNITDYGDKGHNQSSAAP